MAVQTSIDKDSAIIIHKVTGELYLSEVIKAFKERMSHPGYMPGMNVIWDLNEATGTSMSFDELSQISQFVGNSPEMNLPYKVALTGSDDLSYGMARMYSTVSSDTKVKVEVFRNKLKAEEWLLD